MRPDRVIWPAAIERPKTLYLLEGLRQMGIEVISSKAWIKRLRPRSNSRGPYVYPIEFVYGDKRPLVLYDINTIPRHFFSDMMGSNRYYFKIHLHKQDKGKYPRLFVAPNSPSAPIAYLENLETLRITKQLGTYLHDISFLGWHDDRGMRMKCVKIARAQSWNDMTGLMPFKHHTTVPANLLGKRLSYLDHLAMQAKTKLNLALPGGRALPYCSFRHVELWGIGAAVLTIKPDAVLPGNPQGCWIEFKRDLSDFVKVVNFYLEHDDQRERIADKGRRYFDKYLTPKANAEYICKILFERVMK